MTTYPFPADADRGVQAVTNYVAGSRVRLGDVDVSPGTAVTVGTGPAACGIHHSRGVRVYHEAQIDPAPVGGPVYACDLWATDWRSPVKF